MPAMANITVKKADGTTSVTYTAIIPSGGDKLKAVWRQETYAGSPANRPILEISAKYNTAGNQRIVEGKLSYPELVTDTNLGVTTVRLKDIGSFAFTQDLRNVDATVNEAAAQFANLIASTLIQECLRTGVAPT